MKKLISNLQDKIPSHFTNTLINVYSSEDLNNSLFSCSNLDEIPTEFLAPGFLVQVDHFENDEAIDWIEFDLNDYVKAAAVQEQLNLEITEEEKALRIKNIYNLNLKSNRLLLAKRVIKGGKKTVLLNYGFSNKRCKVVYIERTNEIGINFDYFTLDQFINGDFEIKKIEKEPQVKSSLTGWASLENLMNKTWNKKGL